MKKIALLFLLLSPVGFAWSQGAEQMVENVEQIGQRKLVVIVEEPDPKLIAKWEKKGLSNYIDGIKTAIATYNSNLKEVVEKFWEYKDNGIEYLTYNELKEKKGNYVVLRCVDMGLPDPRTREVPVIKLQWDKRFEKASDRGAGAYTLNTALCISLIENLDSKPMFTMPMSDILPTKADLIFGVRMTCAIAKTNMDDLKKNKKAKAGNSMELYKEYAKKLTNETLLLREDWLGKDITKEKIAKAYPYKFEIVPKEKLDDLLMQKDPQYAVAVITCYLTGSINIFYQQVMDCENGSLLAVSYPKVGPNTSYRYITEKNLKDFVNGY